MDIEDLTEFDKRRIKVKLAEIYELYDVSEAEQHLLVQLTLLIRVMGYTRALNTKLLKALAATEEMLMEEEAIIKIRNGN